MMDHKQTATNQDHQNPSLIPNDNTKPLIGAGGERLKRDEWSEGAVSSLLEAYESKWNFRNRAKLKGHDWEDVARFVFSRADYTKSPKTQTQCKNKIESMKKRYRSESASGNADVFSSWPLYSRLDNLLRGTSIATVAPYPPPRLAPSSRTTSPDDHDPPNNNNNLIAIEPSPEKLPLPPPARPPAPPPTTVGITQNFHGSNGIDRMAKEDGVGNKSDHLSDKNVMEADSSAPALYSDKENLRSKKLKMKEKEKKKILRREEMEIAESIRWLAEVMMRSEQARMEMMRDIERMRIEAEAKRGEIDIKQTEIIANTQLEIAKLFASTVGKGNVDSSLKIGRS